MRSNIVLFSLAGALILSLVVIACTSDESSILIDNTPDYVIDISDLKASEVSTRSYSTDIRELLQRDLRSFAIEIHKVVWAITGDIILEVFTHEQQSYEDLLAELSDPSYAAPVPDIVFYRDNHSLVVARLHEVPSCGMFSRRWIEEVSSNVLHSRNVCAAKDVIVEKDALIDGGSLSTSPSSDLADLPQASDARYLAASRDEARMAVATAGSQDGDTLYLRDDSGRWVELDLAPYLEERYGSDYAADDFYVSSIDWSHDSKFLTLPIVDTDVTSLVPGNPGRRDAEIIVIDLETRNIVARISGLANEANVKWYKREHMIGVHTRHNGVDTIAVLDPFGSEIQTYQKIVSRRDISDFDWSPNDNRIAIVITNDQVPKFDLLEYYRVDARDDGPATAIID